MFVCGVSLIFLDVFLCFMCVDVCGVGLGINGGGF